MEENYKEIYQNNVLLYTTKNRNIAVYSFNIEFPFQNENKRKSTKTSIWTTIPNHSTKAVLKSNALHEFAIKHHACLTTEVSFPLDENDFWYYCFV